MFLSIAERYDLSKLATTQYFFSLYNNTKDSKKIYNIKKNNVWFEFDSIEPIDLYANIAIIVISEKEELHKKLKDYERAFIFLKKNQYIGHVSMEIDEDLNCFIKFKN